VSATRAEFAKAAVARGMVRRRTRDQVGESAHPMDLLYPQPRVFEQIDGAVFVEIGAETRRRASPTGRSGERLDGQPVAALSAGRARSTMSSVAVSEMRKYPGASQTVPGRTRTLRSASRLLNATSSGTGERTHR